MAMSLTPVINVFFFQGPLSLWLNNLILFIEIKIRIFYNFFRLSFKLRSSPVVFIVLFVVSAISSIIFLKLSSKWVGVWILSSKLDLSSSSLALGGVSGAGAGAGGEDRCQVVCFGVLFS